MKSIPTTRLEKTSVLTPEEDLLFAFSRDPPIFSILNLKNGKRGLTASQFPRRKIGVGFIAYD